jgi:Raf kinase inhibitor-like YbhB/YbcL family protein
MKKILFCFLAISLVACAPASAPEVSTEIQTKVTEEAAMPFEISSPAFANGEAIPVHFSCDDADISPALTWTEPPASTQSFALIMDDPDAPMGTWVHWVLFNISADARGLQEDLPVTGINEPNAIFTGNNSSGNTGYNGPCPPWGTHHYFFKLYALDTLISLLPGATKEHVLKEMEGHILASAELMGTFSH